MAVSTGGLGDTILFSPIIKALHRRYSEAHIELLVANRLAHEAYSYAKEVSHVTFVNFKTSSNLLKASSLFPLIFNARLRGKFDIGFYATGLNPKLAYFMKTNRMVLLKGSGFYDVFPELSALSILAFVMLVLSVWRYRKTV